MMALHECPDRCFANPHNQVTLPMPRHRPILNLSRTFTDHDHVTNSALRRSGAGLWAPLPSPRARCVSTPAMGPELHPSIPFAMIHERPTTGGGDLVHGRHEEDRHGIVRAFGMLGGGSPLSGECSVKNLTSAPGSARCSDPTRSRRDDGPDGRLCVVTIHEAFDSEAFSGWHRELEPVVAR